MELGRFLHRARNCPHLHQVRHLPLPELRHIEQIPFPVFSVVEVKLTKLRNTLQNVITEAKTYSDDDDFSSYVIRQ